MIGVLLSGVPALQSERRLHLTDKPELYKDKCPRFMCNDITTEKESVSRYLSEQVFCFKSDFEDPLNVYVKDCNADDAKYDVYGNKFEGGIQPKLYCHGLLNRCMADPFTQVTERLAGSECTQDYHCKSLHCD